MKAPVSVKKVSHPKCSHAVLYPGEDGRRKRKYFTNETDALEFAKKRTEELGLNGEAFGTITNSERLALEVWRSFATATPDAPELVNVIRDYIKAWRERNASLSIQDALHRFIDHQEAEGASVRHIASLKSRIGRLANDHGKMPVAAMDSGTFSDWLNGLTATRADKAGDKITMTTRDNLKKSCRTFFAYCIGRGWASINPVPLAAKKRTREHRLTRRKVPETMLPVEIERFLREVEAKSPRVLVFWALKFFAGIRDSEAARMTWEMIDMEKGVVSLPASITKTGDARKVKIEPTLREWIEPLVEKTGPIAPSDNSRQFAFRKILRHLRAPEVKGGKPRPFVFPSNAARHSFGTYHLFHFRDPGETALQLGHKGAPTMLWEHYANPAAEEHAAAFWAIRPIRRVVSIKSGRAGAA
jgi:integrase